jgi:hypothetical protein
MLQSSTEIQNRDLADFMKIENSNKVKNVAKRASHPLPKEGITR